MLHKSSYDRHGRHVSKAYLRRYFCHRQYSPPEDD